MSNDPRAATFAAYCRLFETLDPDRLDELRPLCAPGVRFVDPFNDIVGIDRLVALLRHMFEVVAAPRFTILGRSLGQEAGYVRWRFTGAVRGRAVEIDGMSEVLLDPVSGLVQSHVDHWDAAGQVYARLPVIGAAIRALRRLFASPA